MKKLFNLMNDSQYHFSLRKIGVGISSVILGLFFVGINNNTQVAKADTMAQLAISQQMQTKTLESKSTSTANVNSEKISAPQRKVAETKNTISSVAKNKASLTNVKVNASTKNKIVISSDIKNQSPINNRSAEKADKNLDNIQSNQENTKTTIFNVSNFAKNSDQDRTKGFLESKAIHSSAGWENHDGNLYYRDWNGNYLKNRWASPTGIIHYFGKEGFIIRNQWYTLSDKNIYYFDNDGHTVKNKWFTLPDNRTFYFKNNGHTVKNEWYTLPDKKTYYFDNTGHTVRNRFYYLNDQYYWFDSTGHTHDTKYIKQKDLTLDLKNMLLEGVRKTNGYIFVLETSGNEEKVASVLATTFAFNASKYAGETITLITRNSADKNSKEISPRETFSVPKLSMTNINIDQKNTQVSGKINGEGNIFVIDPSENENYVAEVGFNNNFIFDASKYAGKTITLVVRNGRDSDCREISEKRVSVTIPQLFISNVQINKNSCRLSGRLSGSGDIYVMDSDGNVNFGDIVMFNHVFDLDVKRYAGETITLIIKNLFFDSENVGKPYTVYIPNF